MPPGVFREDVSEPGPQVLDWGEGLSKPPGWRTTGRGPPPSSCWNQPQALANPMVFCTLVPLEISTLLPSHS